MTGRNPYLAQALQHGRTSDGLPAPVNDVSSGGTQRSASACKFPVCLRFPRVKCYRVVAKREHGCAKVEGMNELSGVIFLNFLEL